MKLENKLVLVAIMNNKRDFAIAKNEHWYRIPVKSAHKRTKLANYLAFYQTKVFGEEKWAVNYFATIKGIKIVKRADLLPNEANHPQANENYYKVEIDELQRLYKPIPSKRWRRIVFIPTTLKKLMSADEINDLFDESPLEDKLWYEFKKNSVDAERQYYVNERKANYCLDFAIFCRERGIDVECDGDTWHATREKILEDNVRDNLLQSIGWSVLRFNTKGINENMTYCIDTVKNTINKLGGIVVRSELPRTFRTKDLDGSYQLMLFE